MKVCVVEDDIKKGVQGSSGYCPIARALKRLGCEGVWVDLHTCSIGGRPYSLPISVRHFIARFDNDKDVSPLEFEL